MSIERDWVRGRERENRCVCVCVWLCKDRHDKRQTKRHGEMVGMSRCVRERDREIVW